MHIEYEKINENFKNLINFDNKIAQDFSLPFIIIEYITKNCNLFLSQKLMATCKYLRCLQIRIGFCHIYSLSFYKLKDEIVVGICFINIFNSLSFDLKTKNFPIFQFFTEFKTIKIWTNLTVREYTKEIDDFVQTIDLRNITFVHIYEPVSKFSWNFIENILQSSAEILELLSFNLPQNPIHLQLAFSRMPQLTCFKMASDESVPGFFVEDFNNLISIKRKTKMEIFSLERISFDVKKDLIFQFIDLHMAITGKFSICFCEMEDEDEEKILSDSLKADFEAEMKDRKENDISTCEIYLYFESCKTKKFDAI